MNPERTDWPHKPMPADAHLAPPIKTDNHLVSECDEILSRNPAPEIADAWLDERASAMREDGSQLRPNREAR